MEEPQSSDSSVMATITSPPGSPFPIFYDLEILDEISQPSTKMKITDYGDQSRISALPDPIIQYILSFLTVKDVVRTCALSKRWRTVWAAVPTLNFNFFRHPYPSTIKFASFVHKTLTQYTGAKVEKFLLSFKYSDSFSSQVDEWVYFAARRHVEELTLDIKNAFDSESYRLPRRIYSCSSLKVLNTVYCYYRPIGRISWTKLKVLSIGHTELSNEIIAEILSSSPMLEFLKLESCHGVHRLNIDSSSNLKELVIDTLLCKKLTVIEISAPSIHSISLHGSIFASDFKLIDMSSLIEANLNFIVIRRRNNFGFETVNELLKKLHHVHKLTVGPRYLKILSMYKDQFPIFCKLKCLTIDSSIKECLLPGIASLLEKTPELEKLTINIKPHSKRKAECSGEKSWKWKEIFYKCLSHNLKIVEIIGFEPRFAGLKPLLSLIEFLLKNAEVLEKMAIHIKSDYLSRSSPVSGIVEKLQDFLELDRLFSSYPRASPNAMVLLDNPFG